jgi:nucleoside-diphosphate-sugar epimerase
VRILVTGNLGYIGPILTAAFLARGHEVHGYDSALFERFARAPLPRLASQTVADLRDARALRRAIAPCDAVVHLAAMSNDPLGELDPALTRAVNLEATLGLIEASRDRALVVYSSASVYGVSDEDCDEAAPTKPLTLYSELKVASERAALESPTALVLRNGTVHGPAPIIRGDLLLNAMVASALVTRQIVLTTTGATRRPVVDVRDLAAVTVGLLERRAIGLVNVAAANVSVGEAAALVARATGAEIVERHDGADPRNYAMATTKLAALAGTWWHPRPLDASIRDLIWHYGEIRLTAREVRERSLHRIVQYRMAVSGTVAAAAQ